MLPGRRRLVRERFRLRERSVLKVDVDGPAADHVAMKTAYRLDCGRGIPEEDQGTLPPDHDALHRPDGAELTLELVRVYLKAGDARHHDGYAMAPLRIPQALCSGSLRPRLPEGPGRRLPRQRLPGLVAAAGAGAGGGSASPDPAAGGGARRRLGRLATTRALLAGRGVAGVRRAAAIGVLSDSGWRRRVRLVEGLLELEDGIHQAADGNLHAKLHTEHRQVLVHPGSSLGTREAYGARLGLDKGWQKT
mmetsp:Transcript_12842/g.40529  ORF Transcript_12842/g.40529 Transcript_12842/m.40529 type:complete len:249 (+) Transcript_12842:319-1065(+)